MYLPLNLPPVDVDSVKFTHFTYSVLLICLRVYETESSSATVHVAAVLSGR